MGNQSELTGAVDVISLTPEKLGKNISKIDVCNRTNLDTYRPPPRPV